MKVEEITGNSIEEIFCVPFSKLRQYPMNEDLSQLMWVLLTINLDQEITMKNELEKEFLYKLIEKRVAVCFQYKIDWKTIVFLMFLVATPAMAVIYLTYLQYWCFKHEVTTIDINTFCARIFTSGFPSKEDCHILWNNCKVYNTESFHPDNLIDYNEGLQSIKFK